MIRGCTSIVSTVLRRDKGIATHTCLITVRSTASISTLPSKALDNNVRIICSRLWVHRYRTRHNLSSTSRGGAFILPLLVVFLLFNRPSRSEIDDVQSVFSCNILSVNLP